MAKRSSSSNHRCSVLLLLAVSLSNFTARFTHATPTLFPNQTVFDGQSLISSNKTYELGFFSPNGSTNRFVGIWYHNLPIQTVIWVANRERPILDTSGFITFDSQGNLIILDSMGSSIIIASNTGTTNLTTATLLDSGNLVLREWIGRGNRQVLWQSFDNPTDTFLPGMKLGLNGKQNRLLTSWMGPQDPSPGEFSLGVDPNGTMQFLIWRRGKIYWTSGLYGQKFPLVERTAESYLHDIGYVGNWSGGYYTYHLKDSSIISRGVMDYMGQEKRLTWEEDKWVVFGAQPARFSCEIAYYCGANGLCNNNTSPPCTCLSGFEPTNEEKWELGNWADGCKRELPLNCQDGDGFWRLSNVKRPLFYLSIGNSSVGLEDCKAKCLSNCSCTAYASANGNGTGCLLWFGELLGLQESSAGVQDIFVRLVASESELIQVSDHKKKRIVLILIPVAAAVVILLLCAMVCFFRWRKNPVKHEEEEEGSNCSLFSFPAIATATNNFASSNKLGEGGFGPVYKAILKGQIVAVKRLSTSSGQGQEEFKNEITVISKLQHTNLVRLLGYCIQREEKMLIYEYMPNKSLDSYIFDPTKGAELDWDKRFHIIKGIARGLLYLHKYSRLRIIHRDLKASNILLDSKMNPKISDFGMARIFGQNENQANTRRVVGTYGYMSPEYAMSGLFSVKSDVFSFGVLLLEMVSGKKNTAFQHAESSLYLLEYAWQLWREGRGLELADPFMGRIQSLQEVSRSIHVALLCVQDSAEDRPTMSVVVSMLSREEATLPTPKQPAFFLFRSASERDPLSQGILTPNYATLTSIEGR